MSVTLRCASTAGCVLVALAGTAGVSAHPAAGTQTSAGALVSAYADWVHDRRQSVDLTAIDLDAARQTLARLDPGSLSVPSALSPEDAREHRRRLLTAFALELAAVGSRRHAAAAARLVEFACPFVRSHTPQNEYDRAWQLAALAALEGGIDSQALHDHLDHARAAFPDEPRLILAQGIAEEQFSAPSEVLTRSSTASDLARAKEAMVRAEGERHRAAGRAIVRFKEASALEPVRAEAALRLGHVQLRMGNYDAALASWRDVERLTSDRALVYLVLLFRGLAFEGAGRSGDARDAYLAALGVSPGAHSATLRLAALAFRQGHNQERSDLVDALLRDDDPRRDPWWSYYAADWRFWYPRIDRVRQLLKDHA